MITMGIVGGVACGKSLVAQDFQTLGAILLDADRIGHEILTKEHVKLALWKRWGDRILNQDGSLNRKAIADIVFQRDSPTSAGKLAYLESITHPEIEKVLRCRLAKIDNLGRSPMAVLDAAIMLKAGWDKLCDQIVLVDVPRALRLKRGLLRGMTEAQFAAREAAQISLEEKKNRADIVIDNSGTPHQTFQQAQKVWRSLVEIA